MALNWEDLGGSIYANPKLSEEAEFISTQMMRMKDLTVPAGNMALGLNNGDSVGIKLWGRISGVATTALTESVRVPMATPPEYTVSATVYQRGIAVPWTKYREDLDRLGVEDVVVHSLNEHSARTHNTLIYNEAVAGRSFCYSATSGTAGTFTTNGTPSGTAASNLNGFHVRNIVKNLKKNNVPFADGNNYLAAVSPSSMMGLFDDSTAVNGFVDVAKYTSQADGLLNGEVGKYFNVRFIEDNQVIPDNIGSSSLYGSGFVVGLDAIREIVARPMELLANMNLGGDFLRQKAIAWLSVLTYKAVWNHTSHGEGRICHITTA